MLPAETVETYRYRLGDIAFSHINSYEHVGKTALYEGVPTTFIHGMNLLRLRFGHDEIEPKFAHLFMQMNFFREEVRKRVGHAVNQVSINQKNLAEVPFIVAPLGEQRRIVTKLEKLLAKVDACQQRLAKIPILLKRFRQSVLAAACSGRVTADWREDDSCEDDLPIGWRWTEVEALLPAGGIFDGPFGSNLKTSDYTTSGVRVIRLENIGHLRFIGEKETFVSREKYEGLKKHTVGEGDIIFASFIAQEIRACVLPKLSTRAIAKADCFCLRPKKDLVNRKYLVLQLVSQESYNRLVENVHGATRPRINTTQLRKLEVRMCPLAEQQEILRRVEALFVLADQIEARYAKAKAHVEKLTQSILAKAFRGELVPQDPKDEPAEALLRRIRQQSNNGKKA
jgi:type I restriction enzyme S subunit